MSMTFEDFVKGVKAGTIPTEWGNDAEGTTMTTLTVDTPIEVLASAAAFEGAMPDDEPWEQAKRRLHEALRAA